MLFALAACSPTQRVVPPAPVVQPSQLPPPTIRRILAGYIGLRYQVTGNLVRLILCDSSLDTEEVSTLVATLEQQGTILQARFDPECRVPDISRSDTVHTTILVVSVRIDSVQATLVARRPRTDRPPGWQERYVMIDWRSASLTIDRIDTSIP